MTTALLPILIIVIASGILSWIIETVEIRRNDREINDERRMKEYRKEFNL